MVPWIDPPLPTCPTAAPAAVNRIVTQTRAVKAPRRRTSLRCVIECSSQDLRSPIPVVSHSVAQMGHKQQELLKKPRNYTLTTEIRQTGSRATHWAFDCSLVSLLRHRWSSGGPAEETPLHWPPFSLDLACG